jgi:hypothetical protein
MPLGLFRLRLLPKRAEEMNFAEDIVLFPALLGRRELRLELAHFMLSMITAFQFNATFNHGDSSSITRVQDIPFDWAILLRFPERGRMNGEERLKAS